MKSGQRISIFSMSDTPPLRSRAVQDQFSSNHPVLINSLVSDLSGDKLIIPVDSTLEDVVVKISTVPGSSDYASVNVLLTAPSGKVHKYEATLKNGSVTYLQVQAPEPGVWTVA